ncbi:MAG: methyltransferase domain-containing protein [Alphaproteobacteria bacterium]
MAEAHEPFGREAVRAHRERAARNLGDHDFLLGEVGKRLCERLEDIKREFPVALDLGCHGGALGGLLAGRSGIETLIQCDLSPAMAKRAFEENRGLAPSLAADEEFLPFADESFDLILSDLSLHWVNDLVGALIQIRRTLKPDGLFIGAMLGGETLRELREALMEAELIHEGGASPRISPFVDVRDAGDLLQRAGFALPVADCDTITVTYGNALSLMRDLRGMGEANAVRARRNAFTRRTTLMAAAALYEKKHAGADGRIPATFQVVYLSAWAPHESQQQPLRPGSAAARLADALGAAERPAGDKAKPR